MKKWKKWLICRFLPLWAREELLGENERLRRENEALKSKIQRLSAYIDGLETGIRNQRKIVIYNREDGT